MAHDDEDLEDSPEQDPSEDDDSPVDGAQAPTPDAASSPTARFRLPTVFAQPSMPGINVAVAEMLEPIRAQMKGRLSDASTYALDVEGALNRRLLEQMMPMGGGVDSLNVAAASAVAFWAVRAR